MWGLQRWIGRVLEDTVDPNQRFATTSAAVLAEFEALRTEIGRFQSRIQLIQQSAFAVLLGLVTAAAVTVSAGSGDRILRNPMLVTFILVTVALTYFLLACAYAQSTAVINHAAHYIHNHLRPRLIQLTGVPAWDWEIFLAACRRGMTAADRPSLLYPLLEWCFPWLIFILPMVLAAAGFGILNGVLLTNLLGWLSLLLVLLLIVSEVFVAALTRGGRGVVTMSRQELRAWMYENDSSSPTASTRSTAGYREHG